MIGMDLHQHRTKKEHTNLRLECTQTDPQLAGVEPLRASAGALDSSLRTLLGRMRECKIAATDSGGSWLRSCGVRGIEERRDCYPSVVEHQTKI